MLRSFKAFPLNIKWEDIPPTHINQQIMPLFQQMQQKYFSQTLALFETETIPNKLRFHKQKYEENHILYKKWLNLALFTQIFSAMST